MSQETVELAYRAFGAFNRRDLDAFLAFMHPEVELRPRFMEMEGDAYFHGHSGVRDWWDALLAIFPDFRVEVTGVRDFGDRAILALRIHGHGVDSRVPIDENLWMASRLRDGRVAWCRNFGNEAEALEAAGLSE